MKIKDIVNMKGLYSAYDVGEKEIELDVEEIEKIIIQAENKWEEIELQNIDNYTLFIAQEIAKRCPIKVKP